jgi:hypothetical protein
MWNVDPILLIFVKKSSYFITSLTYMVFNIIYGQRFLYVSMLNSAIYSYKMVSPTYRNPGPGADLVAKS